LAYSVYVRLFMRVFDAFGRPGPM